MLEKFVVFSERAQTIMTLIRKEEKEKNLLRFQEKEDIKNKDNQQSKRGDHPSRNTEKFQTSYRTTGHTGEILINKQTANTNTMP